MRIKTDPQDPLDFAPATLKVTREYHEKYLAVDRILTELPEVLTLFHRHVSGALNRKGRKRRAQFTSDQLFRAILVMELEGLTYREAVVRIDDSHFLRRFVRVHDGPVMDFTLLCRAYKAVPPGVWKEINQHLGRYAIERELISGDRLRVDTTACETNIHYPTDSSLLGDVYRVLSRLIGRVREHDPQAVGAGRLQERRVRRLVLLICRRTHPKSAAPKKVRKLYRALLAQVSHILDWSCQIRGEVAEHIAGGSYDFEVAGILGELLKEMDHYGALAVRVIDQASRRVLKGEQVPNSEKIFSIFEPHTELLQRGRVAKPIEFGHMVLLQQVEEKFITDFEVFERRPTDESLIEPILKSHEHLFGELPACLAADKGFYRNMETLRELETRIPHVSIAKKGGRTPEEEAREHHPTFRASQRFRAGIEGTISALKRAFKLSRCLYHSFRTFCSSTGCHVFAHNLLVLARL